MDKSLPLRDIHLPTEIGLWPMAIGWWLLILFALALIYLTWRLLKQRARKARLRNAFLMLSTLQQDTQSNKQQKLQQLSTLLRRVAISHTPRAQCAGLSGKAWLQYLDASLSGKPFSEGVGSCLADAHYQNNLPDDIDITAVFALCKTWLKAQTA